MINLEDGPGGTLCLEYQNVPALKCVSFSEFLMIMNFNYYRWNSIMFPMRLRNPFRRKHLNLTLLFAISFVLAAFQKDIIFILNVLLQAWSYLNCGRMNIAMVGKYIYRLFNNDHYYAIKHQGEIL